jgi:hypothetical protein
MLFYCHNKMDALIQKKYFIGKSTSGVWSSVYTYKPQSREIRETHGEIFATICLKGPKDFSLPTAGNMLLDRFHEAYFENKTDKVLIALEKALLETGKYLQKILENDSAADIGIDLNLIAMVINGDVIYVSSLGKGKLYAYRDNELTDLSEALRDPTGEGLVREASLVAKKGDVYLLGTPEMDQEILKDEFQSVAQEFSEQPLKTKIYQNEANIGLLIVGYNIDRNRQPVTKPAPVAIPVQEVEQKEEFEKEPEELTPVVPEVTPDDNVISEAVYTGMAAEGSLDLAKDQTDYQEETPEFAKPVSKPAGTPLKTKFAGAIGKGKTKLTGIFGGLKERFAKRKRSRVSVEQESAQDLMREPELIPEDVTIGEMIADEHKQETQVPQRSRMDQTERIENRKTYQVVLVRIRDFIWKLLVGIKRLVWDKWLGMGPSDNIYLRSAARKRKWGFLVILILVIAGLLYYSIQGMVDNQKQMAKDETAAGILTEAKGMITTAKSSADLLAKTTNREDGIAQVLTDLQTAQAKLDQAKASTKLTAEIATQEQQILAIKDELSKSIVLTSLNLLTDLGDKFPGANPVDMVLVNKKLYVADAKYNNITSVDYSGNRVQLAGGLNIPRSITADDQNHLIVLDSDPDKQIGLVNLDTKVVDRLAASSESKVGGATQVEFANIGGEGRIYLLDNRDKSILYYSRTKTSYTTAKTRNTMDELATAKDFQVIDGKIYLLMQKDLGLYRDTNQKQDQMNLIGLKTGDNMLKATALYVDGVYVYVADPANKRILIFNKTGYPDTPFVAQYVYRGNDTNAFTNIKEITADRDGQKIFVLDGSGIYVLDMTKLSSFTN